MPRPSWFPAVILSFAVAAAVHVAVNHGLLWGMLLLLPPAAATPPRGRLDLHLPLLLVSDLGYATLGLLIAALWDLVGAFAAVLVLIPLFVARWAMGQFAAQEGAYSATMAALCQAVETKDFYTRGHSERVSRGATMLAREIGMGAERVAAIRYAGMLHDVGKLGVPTRVLQKTGPLTEEELAAIQLHPMRGLEIVRQIGFLTEALDGIMHHHERIDGKGYPMGLAGDEIPEFARVIAVADAFDSMTSARSYRGDRRGLVRRMCDQGADQGRRTAGPVRRIAVRRAADPGAAGRGHRCLRRAHRAGRRGDGAGGTGPADRAAAGHPDRVPPVRRDPVHLPADGGRAGPGHRGRRLRGGRALAPGGPAWPSRSAGSWA